MSADAGRWFVDVTSTGHVLIPEMGWEMQAAGVLSMSHSQTRFIIAMCTCIPLSAGMRLIHNTTLRHLYSVVVGVLLVMYPFGHGIYQLIFPVAATYLSMLLSPRHCVATTWVFVFGYLVWLQVVTASGMAWNEGAIDFVGAIMILTLKLIAMAQCYQDGLYMPKGDMNEYQRDHAFSKLPNPLAYLSFVFACGNLLCGPPIEYSEYATFVARRGVPLGLAHGCFWIAQAAMFMAMHLLMIGHFEWGVTNNFWFRREPYLSLPLWQRLGCHVMCGFSHQIKYYFLWKLAESANVFSGFDFVGWDLADRATWGRCTNVRFLGMWLSDSASIVPTHWNIRTGIFLRRYVYERIVGPAGRPGFVHILITQLVTAFWHGVYPGYIIFFIGTVFYLQAARTIYRAEKAVLPKWLVTSWPWWLLKVAWTDVAVCYMSMAFVLLEWDTSIEMHSNVYFIPHAVMAMLCVLGLVLPSAGGGKAKKKAE
ncbi:hypothetical protein FOA52_007305 [Chlamydomonas sp. UWO 241]|nr:hypothetical protein FOA52_007305 [Chlamydomonas sp. UWO 241]